MASVLGTEFRHNNCVLDYLLWDYMRFKCHRPQFAMGKVVRC